MSADFSPGDVLTVEQMEALPVGAKVKNGRRAVWILTEEAYWHFGDNVPQVSSGALHQLTAPITLVSLPETTDTEPAQTWKPLQRITREQAEGLPDDAVVLECPPDGGYGSTYRRFGSDWIKCGVLGRVRLSSCQTFTLLWHPDFEGVAS